MKYFLLPAVILFFGHCVSAQNIVVNGDLEDINTCVENNAICSPSGWFYYRSTGPQGYLTTLAHKNYPSASGVCHFSLMAAYLSNNYRDYWQTKLLCPVIAGKKYVASVQISTQQADPNLNDIGFWLTDAFISTTNDTILSPIEFVSFTQDATVKQQKTGWFLVTKEFTVSSDHSILVIGNFSKATNTEILATRMRMRSPVTILVDDIQINTTKGSACVLDETIADSLYAEKRRHTEPQAPAEKIIVEKPKSVVVPKQIVAEKPPVEKMDSVVLTNLRFDLNSSQLRDTTELEKLTPYFTNHSITHIEVVGFTDESGTELYNSELSKKRAQTIGGLIAKKFHLSENIFTVTGAGISRQFTKNELNRRVVVRIYSKVFVK